MSARRLRAHGMILATCLWLVYAWDLGTPGLHDRAGNLKGTDFLHFYTLGALALEHRGADLYDMNAQAALAAWCVPDAAGIRYLPLYPPQVSILFAPWALFPYAWALALWWACSAVIYALCCYAIWRASPSLHDYGGTVALLAVAYPAFFHLIAWGQTSALALACFTGMFFLLRDRRNFLAGIVLGCLIFKPQLGMAAAVIFVAIGAWKVVGGALVSAGVQLAIGVLYYGGGALRRWIEMLRNVRSLFPLLEPRSYQTHSLRTFWEMLVPWGEVSLALYVVSALLVLGMTVVCWKRRPETPLALRYSALLLATVLIAPHLTVYDLVILAPAFLLLGDWIVARSSEMSAGNLPTLLYLAYLLPLAGPFARWTHVQLSVIAMAAVLVTILRYA